jgi:hypothetical protein
VLLTESGQDLCLGAVSRFKDDKDGIRPSNRSKAHFLLLAIEIAHSCHSDITLFLRFSHLNLAIFQYFEHICVLEVDSVDKVLAGH